MGPKEFIDAAIPEAQTELAGISERGWTPASAASTDTTHLLRIRIEAPKPDIENGK